MTWHFVLHGLSGTALTAASTRQRLEMFRQANDAAGERQFIDRMCQGFRKVEETGTWRE